MSHSYRIAHALDSVVRRVDAQMHRRMRVLDTERLGPLGGLTMLYLEDDQPTSIHALSERMGRDNSQMTRVIRGLETKGIISRRTSKKDRRVALIELTERGEAFLEQIRAVMSETVDEVTATLTNAEREHLHRLLLRLLNS